MNAIGNKARTLVELQNLGVRVPGFFVLDVFNYMKFLRSGGANLPNDVSHKVGEKVKALGGHCWIVRSSDTKENGHEMGFNGSRGEVYLL
jgi:hypothetical protein